MSNIIDSADDAQVEDEVATEDVLRELDAFGRDFALVEMPKARDVAEWNKHYLTLEREGRAYQEIAALKAAIAAGWVTSPATAFETIIDRRAESKRDVYRFDDVDVDDMTPAETAYYGALCLRYYEYLRHVPKV